MSTKLRAALAVPVLFLLALLAVGCGLGGDSSSDRSSADAGASSGSVESEESTSAPPDATARDAAGADSGVKQAAGTTPPMTRAVISTGQISLEAGSLVDARAEVMRLVGAWNGSIADEQTHSDDRGRMVHSTMTIRVPTARFGEAMTALEEVGEVEEQSRKSEDVTTQVLDTEARVRAAERSIRQIEALLGRARKLSDIIAIEADLARRQADLDSLKSQQAWLEDQTSLSTITVQLSRAGTPGAEQDEDRGFLAGLAAGWEALETSTTAVLTALGAVLPFGVLLAVLGTPVWIVVRRRLSAGSAPARSA
jgi:hypothetical protein